MKRKKGKVTTPKKRRFLIIATTLVILGSSFIIYDSHLFEKAAVITNSKEEIKLSLTDPLIKNLSETVIKVYTNDSITKYKDYFYRKDKTILEKEDLSFKVSLAAQSIQSQFANIEEGYDCANGICGISYIDEESLKNAYQNLYGTDESFEKTAFTLKSCTEEYRWSKENNRYEAQILGGCGGTSTSTVLSYITSAKEIKEEGKTIIEINEAIAVEELEDNGNAKYYGDYEKNRLIEETSPYNEDDIELRFYQKYRSQMSIYKYTFERNEKGIFGLKTVERIK